MWRTRWEVTMVGAFDAVGIDRMCSEGGWEPFAVSGHQLFLRRIKKEKIPR